MLYKVSYGDYDTYVPYIVEGPEVPDWKVFCDSLLPEACGLALANHRSAEHKSWLGWHDIIECLVMVLQLKGYRRLRPIEAAYEGTNIVHRIEDMNFASDNTGHSYKEVPETPALREVGEQIVQANLVVGNELYTARRNPHRMDQTPEPPNKEWAEEGF